MTLKTSFFNKAIYKSTLKRYMWGSVLYFVLLFLVTGFSVLMLDDEYTGYSYYRDLMSGDHILVPILMAIVVPTVTALLVFRCFHSKQQAIFTFSLPATRSACVISEFLGGLTLMLAPVVLNGIILILISNCGYGWYLSAEGCLEWVGYNAFGIFMMYSCAVFAASITGNAFSGVIINILLHCFLSIIVAASESIADIFIYGFTYDNAFSELIGENNFVVVVFGFADEYFRAELTPLKICVYAGASVILCVLSYIFFLNRKVCTASEAAGFRCLNGIFKYTLTLLTAMFTFGACSDEIFSNTAGVTLLIILLSLIAYVISEMVIRKRVNVFYAWKGYVCFVAVMALIVGAFAGTSFFGYETRVPAADDVKRVSVYEGYYSDEVFVDDKELNDSVIKIHSEITADIPVIKNNEYAMFSDYICITYELANGKRMARRYMLEEDAIRNIIYDMYENEAYKRANEPVFAEDDRIVSLSVENMPLTFDAGMLLEALRKDIILLDYKAIHPEMYPDDYDVIYCLNLEFETENNDYIGDEKLVADHAINVTENFVNTVAYLSQCAQADMNTVQ